MRKPIGLGKMWHLLLVKYRLVRNDCDTQEIYERGACWFSRCCHCDQFNGPPYGTAESMKDHCRFFSVPNVSREQESLYLYWNSTETSQKKWWLYIYIYKYNNFTTLFSSSCSPLVEGQEKIKEGSTATLWELWPISLPQNCHSSGN